MDPFTSLVSLYQQPELKAQEPIRASAMIAWGLVQLLQEQGIAAQAFSQEQTREGSEWRMRRRVCWIEIEGGERLHVREPVEYPVLGDLVGAHPH